MSPELHLRLAGGLQIALAAVHLFFPKRFPWKDELSRLSRLNRQILIVHTIIMCYVLPLMGARSWIAPQALHQPTPLSRLVLGGMAEPDVETRNRTPVKRPIALGADREPRLGPDNRWRVFSQVNAEGRGVRVLTVGVRDRNRRLIGGEEVEA